VAARFAVEMMSAGSDAAGRHDRDHQTAAERTGTDESAGVPPTPSRSAGGPAGVADRHLGRQGCAMLAGPADVRALTIFTGDLFFRESES